MNLIEFDILFNKLFKAQKERRKSLSQKSLFYNKSSSFSQGLGPIYDDLKKKLYDDFGIVGGGIGLLNLSKNKPELLFGRNLKKNLFNEKIDQTEILDFEYPSFEQNNELINLSFFTVREVVLPEYVKLFNEGGFKNNNRIEKHSFLKENNYIWITNSEIKSLLSDYDRCLARIFYNNNIQSFEDLLSSHRNNEIRNESLCELIKHISDAKGHLKENLISSINKYIGHINTKKPIEIISVYEEIDKLSNQANFPILSYSLIYAFKGSSADFSHIVFPVWNTFTEDYAYNYKKGNETIKEFSLVHALYTVDNHSNAPSAEKLIAFKFILKQFIEPIIDNEHYRKLKEIDLSVIRRESVRNRKLDLAAFNIAHTYSSHVYPFVESFLNKIQEKIYKLYEIPDKKDEKGLEYLKNYHKDQFSRFTRLATNISSANNRFNQSVEKMYYASYNSKELFEVLTMSYFTSISSHLKCNYENAISLGITDGRASCVLKLQPENEYSLAIPYGEIGKTMLMMLITNLFRNLHKHSTPSSGLKYIASTKKIKEFLDNSQEYHKLDVSISIPEIEGETELEKRFADEYYKVSFEQKSHHFDKGQIVKFEGIDCPIEQVIIELNKRFQDWSEESINKWKGLKEIRMIASVLIGCPIEEIDYSKINIDFYEYNDSVYPKKLVEYDLVPDKHTDKLHLTHNIYLRKSKFCTIWLSDYDYSKLEQNIKDDWFHQGIVIKVNEQDSVDPLSTSSFVIDCKSGRFYKTKEKTSGYKSLHYNFRFLVLDFKEIKNISKGNLLTEFIKKKWIENNPLLESIHKCVFVPDKNLERQTEVFSSKDFHQNSSIALIDNHFKLLMDNEGHLGDYSYIECNNSTHLNKQLKTKNESIEYLQREAVNTEVIVFDEVLQGLLFNGEEPVKHAIWKDKTLEQTLALKGVYVPSEINGKSVKDVFVGSDSELNIDDLSREITSKIKGQNDKIRYVIIHYSGLEKVIKNSKDILNSFVNERNQVNEKKTLTNEKDSFAIAYEYLTSELEGTSTQIVLCSGKFPSLLPSKSYFIDRESLKYFIFEISSKIQLVNQLLSLRIQEHSQDKNS